jgi:hypothetical protein
MLPDETDVTCRRAPWTEPVKETETGAIELPSVTAATGKLELSAVSIAPAAPEKLLTPERSIGPEYV